MAWRSPKGRSSALFDIVTRVHSLPHSQLTSRRALHPPALTPHFSGLPPVCTALPLPDMAGKRDETGPGPVGLASVTAPCDQGAWWSGQHPSLFMADTLRAGGPHFHSSPVSARLGSFHFGAVVKDVAVNVV